MKPDYSSLWWGNECSRNRAVCLRRRTESSQLWIVYFSTRIRCGVLTSLPDMSSGISLCIYICVVSHQCCLLERFVYLEITKKRRALVLIYSVRSASTVGKTVGLWWGGSRVTRLSVHLTRAVITSRGGGDAILGRNRDLSLRFFSLLLKGCFACSFTSAICTSPSIYLYIFYRSNFLFYWSRRWWFFFYGSNGCDVGWNLIQSRSNDRRHHGFHFHREKISSQSIDTVNVQLFHFICVPLTDQDVSIEMAELSWNDQQQHGQPIYISNGG